MVLDVVQRRLQRVELERFEELAAEIADLGAVAEAPPDRAERRPPGQDEAHPLQQTRVRIAVDRDVVDVVELDAGLIETVADRRRREARPMLDPAEALLLRRRDELAVDDDAGGGISVVGVDSNDNHRGGCGSSSSIATSRPTILQQARWLATSHSLSPGEAMTSWPSRAASATTPPRRGSRRGSGCTASTSCASPRRASGAASCRGARSTTRPSTSAPFLRCCGGRGAATLSWP